MTTAAKSETLPSRLTCCHCKAKTYREIRCRKCGHCPVCGDDGFLLDVAGDGVVPCYNCNPDGMEGDESND